jgi:tetratricopeptide (TPR) repeat protein
MNNLKIFSIAILFATAATNAQDLESAKKAIDAEQNEKAKTILKGLIASKPDFGKNYFILGNVYLTQKIQDSAAIFFNKGLTAKNDANFNNIGLGQIELENGKLDEAKAIFDKTIMPLRKKDYEEYLYIGRAYMATSKPDYKTALVFLEKAKAIQPNDAQVLLSLGDSFYGVRNNNDAFSAYRDSYEADKTVIRAKLQLARITKEAKAFPEALSQFEAIKELNPAYGPTYREMAETYFLMGLNNKDIYAESNKKALEFYDKYMSMTDYSLDSRMRHADFLMLTKDYKALEAEANAMQKLDKVNPRIFRYLGYSAYQTGNTDGAIKALNDFLANPGAKVIGRDYLYLGLAKTRKALTSTGEETAKVYAVDTALFNEGVADMKKGVDLDPIMANELNDFGKIFFDIKRYKEAAAIYEVATTNTNSRNYKFDNFYLGYALYFDQAKEDKPDSALLQKANTAFTNVITLAPNTQDAHIYKARVNSLYPTTDANAQAEMSKSYEDYIRVVTAKGEAELSKPATKTKLIEAYTNIGVYYIKTDKLKAKENFEKVLLLDPTNADATANIKFVK